MKKILLGLCLISGSCFAQTESELNEQGIEAAKNNRFETAIDYFNQAIQKNPDYARAYFNRGNVHRAKKEFTKAIDDYSKSIALNGKLNFVYGRANTYMDLKDFEKAIIDYSRIIKSDPNFENIYFDRGYAYIMSGKYPEAKKDMEKQLELNPHDLKSLTNLAHLKTKLGMYEEALKDYDLLLEYKDNEHLYALYNNKADLYKEISKYEMALDAVNKAIELKPDYAIGFSTRAGIYLKLGDKLKACNDYKRALELGIEKNEHYKLEEDDVELKKICK